MSGWVEDARLATVEHECPECGRMARGTGRMRCDALTRRWLVEYRCVDAGFLAWSEKVEDLTRAVAADHGR
ncbi:MAG: hypothetical protein IT380_13160 [Myxococcales bacterium]|nr:hypothetical protein [Myxococcales bacterium]